MLADDRWTQPRIEDRAAFLPIGSGATRQAWAGFRSKRGKRACRTRVVLASTVGAACSFALKFEVLRCATLCPERRAARDAPDRMVTRKLKYVGYTFITPTWTGAGSGEPPPSPAPLAAESNVGWISVRQHKGVRFGQR